VFDPADHYTSGGLDNYTRTTECPLLEAKTASPPGDGTVVPLAKIVLDAAGNAPPLIDNSIQTPLTAKLANGSVANAQLANLSVNTAKLADAAVTETKLAANSVTAAIIRDGNVGTAELADLAVATGKIADLAVTEQKLANNAVTALKIKDGSVGTAELADNTVPLKKLKLSQAWDSTATIAAGATAGFNVLAVALATPRGATILVSAYTTTANGSFEWSERSSTGGAAPNFFINQAVFFHNLSTIAIEIKFKIWELLPE